MTLFWVYAALLTAVARYGGSRVRSCRANTKSPRTGGRRGGTAGRRSAVAWR